MGIADFLVPLITDFTGFVIYMISFGIFDGCYVLLQGIAVNDVVGRDNISSGLGIKFFCMAITSFIGPPIAGEFTVRRVPCEMLGRGKKKTVKRPDKHRFLEQW